MSGCWPAGMRLKVAAAYIGLSPRKLWESDWIPKVDMRDPGAGRPVWIWRRADLDAALERRLVQPGQASPFGE